MPPHVLRYSQLLGPTMSLFLEDTQIGPGQQSAHHQLVRSFVYKQTTISSRQKLPPFEKKTCNATSLILQNAFTFDPQHDAGKSFSAISRTAHGLLRHSHSRHRGLDIRQWNGPHRLWTYYEIAKCVLNFLLTFFERSFSLTSPRFVPKNDGTPRATKILAVINVGPRHHAKGRRHGIPLEINLKNVKREKKL